jgi:hypothetical protein
MSKPRSNPIIVKRTERGIAPVSTYDDERLSGDAIGTEYDLVKRSRRSLPQHRLYWQALSHIVAATELWATAEHLHDEIKLSLGYVRKSIDLRTGREAIAVDSTAFNAMNADEFKTFFDKAVVLLAEHLGTDPLAFLEQERAA